MSFKCKYPRYRRDMSLACKLNDEQIGRIKDLRRGGVPVSVLSRAYGVSRAAIWYWTMPGAKAKVRRAQRRWLFRHPGLWRRHREVYRRAEQRKKTAMREPMLRYNREVCRRRRRQRARKKNEATA